MFRIPWKHAAHNGWSDETDGVIYKDWSKHTGEIDKQLTLFIRAFDNYLFKFFNFFIILSFSNVEVTKI